ncbi:uncharacterized protein UTRI_05184_B [Ustilago trichophora]|uniref:Shugoshin C-terminal domain-containing protein n=1 Tax=Ustilago trichophora TaxID=86804 RepID=A0A5C3EKU9_9BASI|nr:uncharacterized protein UTRI_05184_B [Ustilago trichophora]
MPPATRREVRLSASLPHPTPPNGASQSIDSSRSATLLIPNMESILENFEQFKRKHISQNREIIKANAVAQIRNRELEDRIQSLENEKIQNQIDTISLTNQLAQLRRAIGCIHAGWEAIGRGLALGAADSISSQLPASNRVSVEPNSNTILVRSVAKPPEGHIVSLPEESPPTSHYLLSPHSLAASDARARFTPAPEPYHHHDWQQHFEALRAAQSAGTNPSQLLPANDAAISTLDIDGAPSPMGSPELPMELEDALAAASSRSTSRHWSLPQVEASTSMPFETESTVSDDQESNHSANRQPLRRSGRKSSRRQSGYIPHSGYSETHSTSQSPDPDSAHSTPAPSSDPYPPSESNSETMDGILMYTGRDQAALVRSSSHHHPPTPFVDITNGAFASSSSLYHPTEMYMDDDPRLADATPRKTRQASDLHAASNIMAAIPPASEARTPGGRKRKVPIHETHDPMPTPARLFSATIDQTPSAAVAAAAEVEADPQTGRTRRVRKSINYALPKLNTKMRKPDPSDLVPASTPHRSNGATPASARGMIGSTGNLSDIRKLHEAAALRQSPAERTSNMRSKGSPGRVSRDASRGEDEGGARMADLFEIRQHATYLAEQKHSINAKSSTAHSFWGMDGIADTSDDDSRVTSNADLGELAELEAAMGDLCTADEVRQVDTPRAPQTSMWPSRSATQMSASSSTDSMASCSSNTTSNGTGSKRPSLRRKTTTLPSRSRQSSVEQPLQTDVAPAANSDLVNSSRDAEPSTEPTPSVKTESSSSARALSTAPIGSTKTAPTAQTSADTKKAAERVRPGSAASTSTEQGNGRPPAPSGGLAAGMKPKQRPASAGAAMVGSRSTNASSSANANAERPRTFSGTSAANAGLTQSTASMGSVGRTVSSTSSQRASLHSALTNQTKATPGQATPRIGAKGLPASTTPSFKESPRFAGTPVLRPTLSTSSLASESSGRSSPALSAASTGSTGTQLSTSTRTSLKASATPATSQAKTQRPGTAGSTASSSSFPREGSTPRLKGSTSSTSLNSARPQPARSMPSLRRATEKTGVTSTPRITVRSSSSTLPAAAGAANSSSGATPAASIAASKVAKAISSTTSSRAKESASTPMGLGIDFSSMLNDGSAGKELIHLTDEIDLQGSSSSSGDPSSSFSSEAHSSSPTSASKTSSDDTSASGASLAKARRTSRRISGMTA